MTKIATATFIAALVFSLAAQAKGDQGATVRIKFKNARSAKGVVRCTLYNSKEGFPTKPRKAMRRTFATIKGARATCTFENLPRGVYAVAAYHDEDNNNEMKSNFLGIPREGTAATNNAEGTFGPPSFKDASFRLGATGFEQTVKLDY